VRGGQKTLKRKPLFCPFRFLPPYKNKKTKNHHTPRAFLEKRYAEDMGIEDAIHTALLTLKEGFEGQVSGDNVEVAVVGTGGDRSFRVLPPSEVNDYLAEVD